jgi:hypothetical protein
MRHAIHIEFNALRAVLPDERGFIHAEPMPTFDGMLIQRSAFTRHQHPSAVLRKEGIEGRFGTIPCAGDDEIARLGQIEVGHEGHLIRALRLRCDDDGVGEVRM